MSVASGVRRLLPRAWQPVVRYHYERARGLAEREMAIVAASVRPGDLVVDAGACHGVYTHAFARAGAAVLAVEPQTACAATLHAYAAAHPRVRVVQAALGAAAGTGTLEFPPGGEGASPAARLRAGADAGGDCVRILTLDGLDLTGVALIKLDVEGHELHVLRGAARTLERERPLLFVEVEARHRARPVSDALMAIESLGYVGHFLDEHRNVRPVAEFDPARHQDLRNLHGAGGVYINNFFFAPREGGRNWEWPAR